jgi:hypothetical protein
MKCWTLTIVSIRRCTNNKLRQNMANKTTKKGKIISKRKNIYIHRIHRNITPVLFRDVLDVNVEQYNNAPAAAIFAHLQCSSKWILCEYP